MNSEIRRYFLTLEDRQVHYRRGGDGPPVVLLHQSPTSSRELEPLMRRLIRTHSVFAPDMPGYGASDAMPAARLSIELLADNVAAFMEAIGLERAGIYGFHTGASVATALARRHPAKVTTSIAVGLMCLTANERASMLTQYFPPFSPRWDGSHLAWLWSRLKDQSVFFPWFTRDAAARLSMDALPPDAVQANVPDWLRSGEDYWKAYEAAFQYRPEIDLPHIQNPHMVIDYPADPLFAHLDRLPAAAAVRIVRCVSSAAAADAACECLARFPSAGAIPAAAPPRPLSRRGWQDYVTVNGLQLRLLQAGDSGRPVLWQHGAQESVRAWRNVLEHWSMPRRVLAVELPGHGESDTLALADYNVPMLAELLGAALRSLGLDSADLLGFEIGAAVLAALAGAGVLEPASAVLICPMDVTHSAALSAQLSASYDDHGAADFYGGHLLRAWHSARDHRLYFPWYERGRAALAAEPWLDPQLLQQAAADAILAARSGEATRRAEIHHAWLPPLAALHCPVTIAAPRWSPRSAHAQQLAAARGQRFAILPHDARHWLRTLAL